MAQLVENRESSSGLSLAIRLRQDSSEAWGELVDLYGPLVETWSAKAGLAPSAREDVAQEVFLSIVRSIDRFDPTIPGATFRGWVWRITRNAVLKHLAGGEPRGTGGSTANAAMAAVADPWPEASEFEPPPDASATTQLLQRAIAQIKPRVEPRTWQAFWRTVMLGQPTAEAADALGMTRAAVRQAKSRTLHRLRQQLGDVI
ncbi:MAG: sigma-70 family RNA polymerase sigma factor [Planctomycetota bacterium]